MESGDGHGLKVHTGGGESCTLYLGVEGRE